MEDFSSLNNSEKNHSPKNKGPVEDFRPDKRIENALFLNIFLMKINIKHFTIYRRAVE